MMDGVSLMTDDVWVMLVGHQILAASKSIQGRLAKN